MEKILEMQAELFAECVAKLKRWDGTSPDLGDKRSAGVTTYLDQICIDEFIAMNEQGPQLLLLPDASGEQLPTNQKTGGLMCWLTGLEP